MQPNSIVRLETLILILSSQTGYIYIYVFRLLLNENHIVACEILESRNPLRRRLLPRGRFILFCSPRKHRIELHSGRMLQYIPIQRGQERVSPRNLTVIERKLPQRKQCCKTLLLARLSHTQVKCCETTWDRFNLDSLEKRAYCDRLAQV